MDFHFKPNGSTDLNPTSKPRARYRKILETLFRDWRDKSGSEIPFIICQLPNFGPKLPEPVESAWAEIRQAQLDALRLTKTAIVVLIDCGDADVHPPNKKPVGERAAALALRGFHGRKAIPASPLFQSMKVDGNKLNIFFDFVERGLVARPLPANYRPLYLSALEQPLVPPRPQSEIQGFSVCGADRKWVWADARIEGSTVVVQSPMVPQPLAVRYAWADNPTCNLCGSSGLPASPFEA
jgi:sialate O-acetylesterase